MDIKKLTGNESSSIATSQARQAKVSQYQDQQVAHTSREGQDTVSISNRSRQLAKISTILEKDQVSRNDKIAALKEKVQNGTYSVDTREVARSMISFAADGELNI